MAKSEKKSAKEASGLFHNIMKASVNSKREQKKQDMSLDTNQLKYEALYN